MKSIPYTEHTRALAARVLWFEPPDQALANPVRFMAYAFARATHEDMRVLRSFLDDDDLRAALQQAPPGVIDPRSWNYWHVMLDVTPIPPLPRRLV